MSDADGDGGSADGDDTPVDDETPSEDDTAVNDDEIPDGGPSNTVTTGFGSILDRLPTVGGSQTLPVVLFVTALAVLFRLVDLGGRVFHWDEARVGYWILRFDATGEFFYRPIIHGPFLPVVNNFLFDFLPVTDATARLPVALLGGLLPLTALLLRSRLRDREVFALALVLAVDPILLYYSRFMRSDMVVGAFAFTAFALTVAAIDRRNGLLAVPAAASLALAFTAKENALVYVLCLLGAAVLLVDHRLAAVASRTGSLVDALVDTAVAGLRGAAAWAEDGRLRGAVAERVERDAVATGVHLAVWIPVLTAVSALTFVAVAAFFYAPRPDLWLALSGEQALRPVIEAGTVGAAEKFVDSWVSAGEGNPYLAFVWDLLETLFYGSAVTVVLGVIGFFADGYGGDNRGIVAFTTYWAVVSVLGYPIGTDIQAPWLAVHVVLPLSIPAAVGLVRVVEAAESSFKAEDSVGVGLAALVLLAAMGGVIVPNADYWNASEEEDKRVLQWAQPENDVKETLEEVRLIARNNEGTDVLYVGTKVPDSDQTQFWVANESKLDRMPPVAYWHSRLPFPWYTERFNATVTSTPPSARYDELPRDPPPVVIAYDWDREELAKRLDGYEAHEYKFKLWAENVVIFVDQSALEEARAANGNETAAA